MKILKILILNFFLATAAIAQETKVTDLQLLCMTEFPTTSFIGFPEGKNNEKFFVRLVNSNGVEFMPIASHLVTSYDLAILAKRASLAEEIGAHIEFEFPMSECTIFGDGTFRCAEGGTIKGSKGGRIEILSLGSLIHKMKIMDQEYTQIQVTAYMRINGESLDIAMKYDPKECGIAYSGQVIEKLAPFRKK